MDTPDPESHAYGVEYRVGEPCVRRPLRQRSRFPAKRRRSAFARPARVSPAEDRDDYAPMGRNTARSEHAEITVPPQTSSTRSPFLRAKPIDSPSFPVKMKPEAQERIGEIVSARDRVELPARRAVSSRGADEPVAEGSVSPPVLSTRVFWRNHSVRFMAREPT